MQVDSGFKSLSRLLVFAIFPVLMTACASRPTIQSDYDPAVDFGQYKTYGFFSPMGIENPNYSSIYGSIFRDAIGKEMESRGYVLSDEPDLLLNVSARLQDKTKVTTTSGPYKGDYYYGYRRGFYDPWYGYVYGATTHIDSYTQGTVNVDMVDRVQKRMVWEGIAIGRVNEKKSNDERRAAIHAGIKEMFAGYPFRAGQ
jgi:hypothetical protein